jgi:hypothetical protein
MRVYFGNCGSQFIESTSFILSDWYIKKDVVKLEALLQIKLSLTHSSIIKINRADDIKESFFERFCMN